MRHSHLHTLVAAGAAAIVATCTFVVAPREAYAQDTDAQREANTHFQRAVGLYAEADYRAALVEFKRAYEIAPHVTVLYNLGQTYYQLQNYAEALSTFERFLNEGGTAHKAEVENAVGILKTRVGKVDVSTTTPGWDISIDDEPVGKTPLAKPLNISIGRRKITATKAGETTQSKNVEIAAGETAKVELTGGGTASSTAITPPPETVTPPKEEGTSTLLIVGWIGTGALAAGSVVTGILASGAASDLKKARETFPGDKGEIDSKASSATTLALVTDILGASALVLGGVSLYFTLTSSSSSSKSAATTPQKSGGSSGKTVRAFVGGSRVGLEGTF